MMYGDWVKTQEVIDLDATGLAKLYQAIWSRLGGRPYTYMIRDLWHQYPLLWIFAGGGIVGLIGAVLGHLFWGG